jgi:nickel-dependent lactate racemase
MIYQRRFDSPAEVQELRKDIHSVLERLGNRKKILIIPPDFTRFHSQAGELTEIIWEFYKGCKVVILPALGTHVGMTRQEIHQMFGKIPPDLFRVHNWRTDAATYGRISAEEVHALTDGVVDFDWPLQINRDVVEGGYDLVLVVGQVVPHEVAGMAGFNKSLLVGLSGMESIHKSHFTGAMAGIEQVMGREKNPVRSLFEAAMRLFPEPLPIVYVQSVSGMDSPGRYAIRGLFIGDDAGSYGAACRLSAELNITCVERPLRKVVVHLDSHEFQSTWLGNKSIYRTRLAIADGGELIVLAPGVKRFGEDGDIDRMIRRHGYSGKNRILECISEDPELKSNLAAAAHLIHGSSEGRFRITYCAGHLTRQEVEAAGYHYERLPAALKKYNAGPVKDGWAVISGGEEIYLISNPATGLWATKEKVKDIHPSPG